MDRRTLLKALLGSSLSLGLPWPPAGAADPPSLVAVKGNDPIANVRRALELLGGMRRFVTQGDRVVIKPNFYLNQPPEFSSVTDPRIVRTLSEMALAAGAKRVVIVEKAFRQSRYPEDSLRIRSSLSNLQDTFLLLIQQDRMYRQVNIARGVDLKKVGVALDVLEADVFINVPVAKSHGTAKVSFGLKNLMGVVQRPDLWHVEHTLVQAIADFSTFLRPHLVVMDAMRGLIAGGPGWPGQVGQLRTIVAGTDPLAVDAYTLSLSTWDQRRYQPEQIPYLQRAMALGVGTVDFSSLRLVEEQL